MSYLRHRWHSKTQMALQDLSGILKKVLEVSDVRQPTPLPTQRGACQLVNHRNSSLSFFCALRESRVSLYQQPICRLLSKCHVANPVRTASGRQHTEGFSKTSNWLSRNTICKRPKDIICKTHKTYDYRICHLSFRISC